MLHFLINRPIAILMSFIGLILIGLFSIQIIPVTLLPDLDIPQIIIKINYPNTSARELEDIVVRPIRQHLLQINQVKDINSDTRNGSSTIKIDFEFGTNIDLSFIEVNEKIDQLGGQFPKEMDRPRVIKSNIIDIPVFYLSIVPNSDSDEDLFHLSEYTYSALKRRIEQLPQISFADRNGFIESEIRIIPNASIFESLNFTPSDLTNAFFENNLDIGSILVKDNHYQYNVHLSKKIETIKDIENILLKVDDRIFRIKDLAEVKFTTRNRRGIFLSGMQEGIVFSIHQHSGAQIFDLKKSFAELLKQLRKEHPQLSFSLFNDQSSLLKASIDNLYSSLLFGSIAAFIMMFFFFEEKISPLFIGISIPISLIITLIGFHFFAISINIISLSGLILGVGLMIDNTIIIIENIKQFREQGENVTNACVKGANEVIRPLLTSSLTTCSVFIPLIFLSGIGGALFFDQAFSIVFALFSSLTVAWLLIPVLYRLLKKGDVKYQAKKLKFFKIANGTEKALASPFMILAIFCLFTILSLWCLRLLPKEKYPFADTNTLEIKIDWNSPIHILESKERMNRLFQKFEERIQSAQFFIGESQFMMNQEEMHVNEVKIYISISSADMSKFRKDFSSWFKNNFFNANINISPIKNMFDHIFSINRYSGTLELTSTKGIRTPSINKITPVLDSLYFRNISAKSPSEDSQIFIKINMKLVQHYNLNYVKIIDKLKMLFSDKTIGKLNNSGRYTPISIGVENRNIHQLLNKNYVLNNNNDKIGLSQIITLSQKNQLKAITSNRFGEFLKIDIGDNDDNDIAQLVSKYPKIDNIEIKVDQSWYETENLLKELKLILLLALALLYLILAAQFESLILPIIVLLTVPVGIAGSIYLLYITGNSINLFSFTGIIAMSGIVVNDAILKVDLMQRYSKKENMLIKEAIQLGGKRRLKPILMTSITTILAVIPVLFSNDLGATLQKPLVLSIIGGLITGTIASLYFVPVLFLLLSNFKNHVPNYFKK